MIVQKMVKSDLMEFAERQAGHSTNETRNGQTNYMRLKLILPVVEVEKYIQPEECPYGCGGQAFWLRQAVKKQVRDTQQEAVMVRRYECLNCRHTFRVYPQGVSQDHFSQRVKGMAVTLYLLGLSYGAVALMLEAQGRLAEVCQGYLRKGSLIYLEGRLKTNKYEVNGEPRYFTKVVASALEFLDSKPAGERMARVEEEAGAYEP